MHALVFARPDDPSVALVEAAMARRGGALVHVDTRSFPASSALSFGVGEDPAPPTLGGLRLDQARAAWIRHLEVASPMPAGMDPEHERASAALASSALLALLESLRLFVVDPIDRLGAAPLKPRQGQLARALGVEVPRTLVSNDPDAIRAFASRCGGGVIAKMLDSGSVRFGGARGPEVLPTMALGPEDLAELPGVALSPMIFQERVPKRLEARVTVVGQRFFVAAVEAGDAVDIREDPALIAGLRPYDRLPPELRAALGAMMDQLGLNFATFDLVLTPDDRWVFLEMNTVSFFDHVELHAGLPISEAVADLLLGISPPRDRGLVAAR